MIFVLAAIGAVPFAWGASPEKRPTASGSAIVIENVSVVDLGAGVAHPPSRVSIPAAVPRVIDGRGKFLLPGFWDMHAEIGSEARLTAMVREGIVGARDFGTPWTLIAQWRRAHQQGPALLGSGAPIHVSTAPEARVAFDRVWNLDADFVSIAPGLPRDAYIALAEQARHWRMRVAGPLPAEVDAYEAAEARQWSIEGTAGVDPAAALDRWALMGTRLTPLLASAPAEQRSRAYQTVAAARRVRVEILAGSGSSGNIQRELEELVAAGLTPREALESATLAPRRMLGIRDSDFVLLDANPLADIRNAGRIAGVILRGRYLGF
jgi:imidazolonepropionase-like amidohydrolase